MTRRVRQSDAAVEASTTYRFSAKISVEVEDVDGSWNIELLDVTNGYANLAVWENLPFDIDNRTLSCRFKTASNTASMLPVLKVMGGPSSFEETGGEGSTFSISQITVEEV